MIERSWEERWHPLREEWVIIAAHRNNRPWTGASLEKPAAELTPHYLSDCYLCPGNARVSGARNTDYNGIFVFENDLPCVGPDAPIVLAEPNHSIYRNRPARGYCALSAIRHFTTRPWQSNQKTRSLRRWNVGKCNTASWVIGRR